MPALLSNLPAGWFPESAISIDYLPVIASEAKQSRDPSTWIASSLRTSQ
jgi:hypothetical protein